MDVRTYTFTHDDARTRGIDVIVKACGLIDATYTAVFPRQAVDALLAAGWRPPVSDDTKAKARSAMTAALTFGLARTDGTVTTNADVIGWYVAALADAGLLAGPSHLDRLAAWAQAHGTVKIGGGYVRAWESYPGYADLREESLPDVQEAARRVLARLEATDGLAIDAAQGTIGVEVI